MDKLSSMLSLTRKAGRLIEGFDCVKKAVVSGRAKLVLFAGDLSPKTRRAMEKTCDENDIKTLSLPLCMDEVWLLAGKRSGVLAVADEGFSNELERLAAESEEESWL